MSFIGRIPGTANTGVKIVAEPIGLEIVSFNGGSYTGAQMSVFLASKPNITDAILDSLA